MVSVAAPLEARADDDRPGPRAEFERCGGCTSWKGADEWTSTSTRPSKRSRASPPSARARGRAGAAGGVREERRPLRRGDLKASRGRGCSGSSCPRTPAALGPVELAVILREVGLHVAPVPVYASLALAAVPIGAHGTAEQRALLAPLTEGATILTGAYREVGPAGEVATTARKDGDGYVLNGVKTFVPYAREAARILVPRASRARASGSSWSSPVPRRSPSSRPRRASRCPASHWTTRGSAPRLCSAAPLTARPGTPSAARPSPRGRDLVRRHRGRAGADQGVHQDPRAVRPGARAVPGRHDADQRRLHREARAGRGRLGGRLAAGRGRGRRRGTADDRVLQRVRPRHQGLYTCQHLHGGIGLDVTYPLHRYFALGKHCGHLLGGAEDRLDALGALIAQEA